MVKQFDVVLINLDPTVGAECKKTRPCVVVSPDDMNQSLKTVIIAPMTSTRRGWKFRPLVTAKHKSELALDQMRAIDKTRIIKGMGRIKESEEAEVHNVLMQFFA